MIPADAELTPRHEEIPAWDEMPEELKPVLRRQMEVYAGFLEFTDHHVGRLLDALEDLGVLENTLVYYIIGDNGASAEGTLNGTYNEMINFNGAAALETPEFMIERLDDFGGPDSYNHYAVGWAHAMCAPYQWTKQVASHWGGTRNGTIVHWPAGIKARGEMRTQFAHVIDVAPTVLEAAGLPEPTFVHGVQQKPLEGVSMAYSFDDAAAAERHTTQYFEMFCNRGIYHQGWTAVTKHGIPWVLLGGQKPAFDDDVWELYDTTTDWTQATTSQGASGEARRAAAPVPDRGHEVQRPAARRPRRRAPDCPSSPAGPTLVQGDRQLLYGGMGRLSENSVVNIKNKSHAVTAEIEVPDGGAQGVIIAQGGSIGGWSLYLKDGKPRYCYNLLGIQRFYVDGDSEVPAGTHQVRMEFDYAGPGLGKGGDVTLYLDGAKIGEGQVAATAAMIFSADDTCDVGRGERRPCSRRLPGPERVHRRGQLGRDRCRQGRRGRRSPDRPGRAAPGRDGEAVASNLPNCGELGFPRQNEKGPPVGGPSAIWRWEVGTSGIGPSAPSTRTPLKGIASGTELAQTRSSCLAPEACAPLTTKVPAWPALSLEQTATQDPLPESPVQLPTGDVKKGVMGEAWFPPREKPYRSSCQGSASLW